MCHSEDAGAVLGLRHLQCVSATTSAPSWSRGTGCYQVCRMVCYSNRRTYLYKGSTTAPFTTEYLLIHQCLLFCIWFVSPKDCSTNVYSHPQNCAKGSYPVLLAQCSLQTDKPCELTVTYTHDRKSYRNLKTLLNTTRYHRLQ